MAKKKLPRNPRGQGQNGSKGQLLPGYRMLFAHHTSILFSLPCVCFCALHALIIGPGAVCVYAVLTLHVDPSLEQETHLPARENEGWGLSHG